MMTNRRSLLMLGAIVLVYAGCGEQSKNPPNVVADRCELCHADIPPRDSATPELIHYRHFEYTERSKQCYKCHLNYDAVDGWMLDSLHRNGRHDPSSDTAQEQCRQCHDYRDCWKCHSSPYTDDDKPATARVHRSHVVDYLSYKCDSCHNGYDLDEGIVPVRHDNGIRNVNFNVDKYADSFPQLPPAYYNPIDSTCNNLYCHGAATTGGKKSVSLNAKMSRTDSTRCSFCHNVDTLRLYGTHAEGAHVKNKIFNDCENCHPGYSMKGPKFPTIDSLHRDGHIYHISQEQCDLCHGVKTAPALPDQ